MSKTVFISNMSKTHDYSKAAKHGALRPITSGNYPIFKTNRLVTEIIGVLTDSTPDDYLLLSGSSVVAALCTSVWMELHGRCNILLFDRTRDQYVERNIVKSDLRREIEQTIDAKARQ